MKTKQLARRRRTALFFILPGLAGLVISAVISTEYMITLPRSPALAEMSTIPRNINGFVVYQTAAEDRRLSIMEDSSVGIFVLGLSLGLFYLEKWGETQSREPERDDAWTENLVRSNNGNVNPNFRQALALK